jgi:hypothetical protein
MFALFLSAVPASHAAGPSPAARAEIAHLFAFLEDSGCAFHRNGSWFGSREAGAHLGRKYAYLLERGLVSSAEDFIERAATRSSISGEPYRVRCGAKTVESGPWLREELLKYRATQKRLRESR